MTKGKDRKFIKIAIFFILASVTVMFTNGIFTQKAQIADLVFLMVSIPVAALFIANKKQVYWPPFIRPIGIYVSLAALSIFITISLKTTVVEFVGIIYLALLFLLWINIVDTKEMLMYAVWCWIAISIIISVIGLSGIILAYGFQMNNPFVAFFAKHPYINNLYRVRATFFQNEKFFSSYLLISIPLTLSMAFYEKNRKIKFLLFAALVLFFVNVFFTYSRSLVGILSAVYIVIFRTYKGFVFKKNSITKILKISGVVFILIVWVITIVFSYVNFIGGHSKTVTLFKLPEGMHEPFYYRPDIGIKQTECVALYNYSYYLLLKKCALKMFFQHPLLGVGNGAFTEQIKIYEEDGMVPKGYLLYDPHSMFFGSLAENGILGFCALMLLWGTILVTVRRSVKKYSDDFIFYAQVAFYAAIVGFFIQALDIDIMNFRFLWLLFGFSAIAIRLNRQIGENNI
ncbi:MAG: O-antigen ligase family protein [Candidatus Omnitrophota bacterium]|nr:O-antigen ligase family protein [Candidatus Omnitrophota bacterium]